MGFKKKVIKEGEEKKLLLEKDIPTYEHPSKEDIKEILELLREEGSLTVNVDGVELSLDCTLSTNNALDIWCPEAFFYKITEERFYEVLSDIHKAIKEEQDKDFQYMREELPKLWNYYITNKDNSKMDWDFFSDYYKDVFGHRPRSESQIMNDFISLADELGISLKKEDPDKTTPASKKRNEYSIEEVMGIIFKETAERGYHKTSEGDQSTAYAVRQKLASGDIEVDSETKKKVEDCITRLKEAKLSPDDFAYTFKKVVENGTITSNKYDSREFNTLCYVAEWYKRELEYEAKKAEKEQQREDDIEKGVGSEYIADLGQRITVSGEVVEKKISYGTISYILKDAEGHLIQIYPNFQCEIGQKLTLVGTVQRNYERDGQKYSYLNRPRFIKESVAKKEISEGANDISEWGKKALILNDIIAGMNNEEAYYDAWLYTWPDGTTADDVDEYFDNKDDYEDLLKTFKRIYKIYHKDGLYDVSKETLEKAHEFDRELGLSEIADVKNSKVQYETGLMGEVQKVLDDGDADLPVAEDIIEECDEVDVNCEKPYISIYYDTLKDAKTAFRYIKGLNRFKTVRLWSNSWDHCVLVSNFTYDN